MHPMTYLRDLILIPRHLILFIKRDDRRDRTASGINRLGGAAHTPRACACICLSVYVCPRRSIQDSKAISSRFALVDYRNKSSNSSPVINNNRFICMPRRQLIKWQYQHEWAHIETLKVNHNQDAGARWFIFSGQMGNMALLNLSSNMMWGIDGRRQRYRSAPIGGDTPNG